MRVCKHLVSQAPVSVRVVCFYSFAKKSVSSVTRSHRREEVSRYTCGMSRASKERERKERARQYKAGVQPYDLTTQTAYHEAGHVVFSTLHGPGVEIVTIDMQKVEELTGRKGCPGFTQYNEEGRLMEASKVLVATGVGLASEAMFVTGGMVNRAEEDIALLDDLLENQMGFHGAEKARQFARVQELTQAFIEENRAAIKSVAEALIERKTLTGKGKDINQLLKR